VDDVGAGDQLAEIPVARHARGFSAGFPHALGEVLAVHIAEREQLAGHGEVGTADATTADDALGQFFRRRRLAVEAQRAAGNDLRRRHGGEGFEGLAPGGHKQKERRGYKESRAHLTRKFPGRVRCVLHLFSSCAGMAAVRLCICLKKLLPP
jgi:hypothetical protein